MKKIIAIIIIILAAVILIWGSVFYWKFLRGANTAIQDPAEDIGELLDPVNNTDFPLTLPDGFSIEVFADNLSGARDMAFDRFGNIWVSRTKEGIISLLEVEDGEVTHQNDVFTDLNNPHGLAIDPQSGLTLYFAEEGGVYRAPLYSEAHVEKLVDLPEGDGHFTRTLAFGPDDRLYISIGSSCNVCYEDDERRAAIYSMNRDGTDFKQFASGLRNAVFFTWSYVDGRMWATDNGRDLLGDDIPPDEINIIEEGGNYGWPICYGKNIHDTAFDKNTYVRNPCMEPFEIPSYIDIQAHSAPLGLDFIPEEGWPEEYWYDLIVAYHGSWNRTVPTGYKLVRMKLDEFGNYSGTEDFISGWLRDNGDILGRPVAVYAQPGGIMYVTDDSAGVIYRITYLGN